MRVLLNARIFEVSAPDVGVGVAFACRDNGGVTRESKRDSMQSAFDGFGCAFVVRPLRQAAWWHGAVAVKSLGGESKGLGPCFFFGSAVKLLGGWAIMRGLC